MIEQKTLGQVLDPNACVQHLGEVVTRCEPQGSGNPALLLLPVAAQVASVLSWLHSCWWFSWLHVPCSQHLQLAGIPHSTWGFIITPPHITLSKAHFALSQVLLELSGSLHGCTNLEFSCLKNQHHVANARLCCQRKKHLIPVDHCCSVSYCSKVPQNLVGSLGISQNQTLNFGVFEFMIAGILLIFEMPLKYLSYCSYSKYCPDANCLASF